MKLRILTLCLTLGVVLNFGLVGQTLTNYAVTKSNPSFSSINATGSTFTWRNGGNLDDNRSQAQNLGFTFYYMGEPYTSVSVCTNGFIDFSSSSSSGSAATGSYINSYIDDNLDWDPLIAPFWDDLYCNSLSDIKYSSTGTAPNRKFIIEWNDLYGYTFLGTVTFQCVLYENGGVIEFNYSTIQLTAGALSYTIGMNNSSVTETYTLQAANSAIFGTTPVYLISLNPVSNTRFTFTPPTPLSPSGALSFANVSNSAMQVNWQNWCPNCYGYGVEKSLNNSSFNLEGVSPINTYAVGGLNASTLYYYRVYAKSEGGVSSYLSGQQATSSDPGNIKTSVSDGNWNTSSLWSPSGVPSSTNWVIINNTVTGNSTSTINYLTINSGKQLRINNGVTITVNNDLVIDGNINMRGGSLIVNGNLIITSSGNITTRSTAGSNGQITVNGNLINDGSIDLYVDNSNYVTLAYNGNGNQYHVGSGTTSDLYKVTINKSATDTVFVASSAFTTRTNFLTLTSGCFFYAALNNVDITPFSNTASINSNSAIVMKSSRSTLTFGDDVTLAGTLELREGNIVVGSSSSHDLLNDGGSLKINGGAFTIGGCLRPDGSGTQSLDFSMSKGFLYTATNSSYNASTYGFDLGGTGSKFNMTGGSIFLLRENTNQLGFNLAGCSSATSSCTGGAIIFGDGGTPSNTDFKLYSTIDLYDIRIASSNSILRLESALDCHSFSNYEGALFGNGYDISLTGDWYSNGTYTPGSNTTSFVGNSSQSITNTAGEEFNHILCAGTSGNNVLCYSDLEALGNISINANNTLNLNAFNAVIGGNLTNAGTLSASSSNFTFNGSSAQSVTSSSAFDCNDVSCSNSNGLSLSGNEMQIKGSVTLSNSADLTTNGFLTLLESTSYSGRIATLPSGTSVIGNVKVEKCVQGDMGYYGLGTVHNSIDFEQWDNALLTTGFTGTDYPTYNFQSISYYDETTLGTLENGFQYPTNTTNTMDYKKGYYVYVYPDNPGTYGGCYVKLTTTGTVVQGNVSFNISYTDDPLVNSAVNDGWNLVNNCYPSAIDFNAASGWTKTGLNGACYVFDRSQNGGLGVYRSYLNGVGTNGGSRYIPSGQGYWVKANASSPTLQMTESVKVSNFEAITRESRAGQLRFTLFNNQQYKDEAALYDELLATAHVEQEYDAYKLMNAGSPNIYFEVDDSVNISIYGSNFQDLESIPVYVENPTSGVMRIKTQNLFAPNTFACLALVDSFTNTIIDLTQPEVTYTFNYSDTTTVPRFYLNVSFRDAIELQHIACKGDLSGSVMVESSVSSPKTFEWTDANGVSIKVDNNAYTSQITNLAPGNYTLHVTDNSICGGYDTTFTINEPDSAIAAGFSVLKDTVQLENGVVDVTFLNQSIYADFYQWSIAGDTLYDFSPTVTFSQAGVYGVALQAINGSCTDNFNAEIVVLGEDSSQLTMDEIIPSGIQVQRTSTGYFVNSVRVNWANATCEVIDGMGRLVANTTQKTENGVEVNISLLPRAIYFLRITQQGEIPMTIKLNAI